MQPLAPIFGPDGAELCVHCAKRVDFARPFLCVLTGRSETTTRNGLPWTQPIVATLHLACHPVWWAARRTLRRAA